MSATGKAVFLSYASQDAEAARQIAESLRESGIEVWFDVEGGLETGDEWDAKIRRQIKECILFLPVISANTQAREEGYFRIEWDFAAERARGIASGVAFILPIVIDDTREPDALVPDRFRSVQWTRAPRGEFTTEQRAKFARLWSHRSGVAKHQAQRAAETPAHAHEIATAPRRSSRALIFGAALASVAALTALVWWRLAPHGAAEPTRPVAGASQDEAARLVQQARELVYDPDSARAEFTLAESLLKRALDLAPDSARAWAVSSLLNHYFNRRGFDIDKERLTRSLAEADRALRLSPEEPDALFALGLHRQLLGETDRAQSFLDRAHRADPDNPRVLIALANQKPTRREIGDLMTEFVKQTTQPAELHYYIANARTFEGRLTEARAANEQALAGRPFWRVHVQRANIEYLSTADPARITAALDRVPEPKRDEPRFAFMRYLAARLQNDGAGAVRALESIAADYFSDNFYSGPKSYLLAQAYDLAGDAPRARDYWQTAARELQAQMRESGATSTRRAQLANAQSALGDTAAARDLLAQCASDAHFFETRVATEDAARAWLRLDEPAKALALLERSAPSDNPSDISAATLERDPQWAPLHTLPDYPRLLRILRDRDAAGAIQPAVARDWPKNAELKRAFAILERLDAIPEDLRLAEEIVQHVFDRDTTNAESITAMARVHSMWLLRGWDRSTARYQKAKSSAERALQLAPDEPEALSALAIQLYARGAEPQRALDLAQRAVDLCPQEPRFHRIRDNCLWVLNVPSGSVFTEQSFDQENEGLRKALSSALRTVELFPRDPIVRYELSRHYRDIARWQDFERVNEETLALAPVANAMVWEARARFGLHGDLPGMKAVLDQVPPRVRAIERTVFGYFIYAAFTGRTSDGLDALNALTEPWMIDFDFRGPKALLTGALLELSGKKELARVQYELALTELQRSRSLNPEDSQTYLNEAWIKHALGRTDEARAALRVFNEAIPHPYAVTPMATWWFQPIAANLLIGEKQTALALMREAIGSLRTGRETLRQRISIDPRLASLRNDPEIVALLADPSTQSTAPVAPSVDEKSVAVLAFTNLSDDKSNEYFSDGISEELLNVLAKVPGLKVSARTSAFFFKGKDVPIPEIAQKLGVAYVVEGSVRKAGDKVRITAQLINARDGFQVWSDNFNRDLKDVFAVQDEIAGLIARNLSLKMGMTGTSETLDAEVLPLYYAALQAWNLRTVEGMNRAEELLNRTLALAPNFARGHAAMAKVWVIRGELTDTLSPFGLRSGALAQTIKQKVDLALKLDPNCPEAYGALGVWCWDTWRTSEAAAALRRATELNPNYASAHQWLGRVLSNQGYLDEGLASLKRATEVDPLSQRILDNYGRLLLFAGRPREALEMTERALVIQPSALQAQAGKAQALLELGNTAEALRIARALPSDFSIVSVQKVRVLVGTGHLDEVEKMLPQLNGGNILARVGALAALGRRDEALAALDPNWFSANRADVLLFESLLDPLRGEPRFQQLLEQLGVAEAHARAQAWRAAHMIGTVPQKK
jgi:TolB-like protein/Flp pilus assembly protein TadD